MGEELNQYERLYQLLLFAAEDPVAPDLVRAHAMSLLTAITYANRGVEIPPIGLRPIVKEAPE